MVVSRKTTANPIRYGMRMLVAGCRSLSHPPEDKHKYSGMQSIFETPMGEKGCHLRFNLQILPRNFSNCYLLLSWRGDGKTRCGELVGFQSR